MAVSANQDAREHSVQRLKVGLIGLAAVLLLIGLASAVFNSVNRERPVAAIGGAQPATVAAMAGNSAAPVGNEPLAELGVTPSTVDPINQTAPARR